MTPTLPRSEWPLSDEGVRAARELGDRIRRTASVGAVVSSSEVKAVETAHHLALGPEPVAVDEFSEVRMPWVESADDHRRLVLGYLATSERGDEGWEPAAAAQRRFDGAVRRLDRPHPVVVTHGTVMSLWLRFVLPGLDAAEFWSNLGMPDAFLVDTEGGTLERL